MNNDEYDLTSPNRELGFSHDPQATPSQKIPYTIRTREHDHQSSSQILSTLQSWHEHLKSLHKPATLTIDGKVREIHPGAILVIHPSKRKDLLVEGSKKTIFDNIAINLGFRVRFSEMVGENQAIMVNPFINEQPEVIFFS